MAATKSLFFFLLCSIFTLVAQQATAQNYFCFNDKGNYDINSTYHDNLNHLLSTLPSAQNDNGYGFYNLSYGNASNQVFAIGLCDGDTTLDVCQSCLKESPNLLQDLCPNQKEAVIWHDKCMLRYSNRSLYGVMETRPLIRFENTKNVSSNIDEEYFKTLRTLLDHLKSRAAAGGSLRKFAVDDIEAPGFITIYGFVQCTPDLSLIDCNNCLDDAFGYFPGCCSRKIGGGTLGPSCKFRYDNFLFYNSTTAEVPSASPPSPTASPPPPLTMPGAKNNTSSAITIVIVVASAVAFGGIIISIYVCLRRRKAKKPAQTNKLLSTEPVEEISSVESLHFSFETIRLATNNFSEENKLGQGGFGVVYRGRLSNGQEIAVKKLSRGSAQGDLEFKNEVMLVAKLQHRNLVRLLGFSMEGIEKLLIYEFVQNASLDLFIFDPKERGNMDWDRRYKIIGGVARGLLYLHEDSRLRIIHRDLKASNILLDEVMNPKISDFGMARLFVVDQTQDNTRRIVGTYGYMAPEYVMHGQFSVKSDVFSFGVLLLEIISGQKNNCFRQGELAEDLLSYTWRLWREGNTSKMVDPLMRVGSGSEIRRCTHIGLLCVQENMANRPTMNAIVLMLNSNSLSLPLPSKPAFFMHSNTGSNRSSNHSKRESVNDASITELHPP